MNAVEANPGQVAVQDVTLRDLIGDLWRLRWRASAIVIALGILGGVLGFVMTDKYEATVATLPVLEEQGAGKVGGIGSLLAKAGGLASMAGISIGGDEGRSEAIATLRSELIARHFIESQGLLPILYEDKWDEEKGAFRPNRKGEVPTVWRGSQRLIKDIVSIVDDKRSGLVTLTVTWEDPELAAAWANGLVRDTNQYLRNKAIVDAERNIAFLNEQAAKTNVVEARQAIYSLLSEEMNRQMLAQGREEYALKVLDPAVAPEKPSSPGPIVMTIVGLFAGGMGVLAWVFFRRALSA